MSDDCSNERALTTTAYHEAAHAAVGFCLHMDLGEIDIIPVPGQLGRVEARFPDLAVR